jgi:hypothetical protein
MYRVQRVPERLKVDAIGGQRNDVSGNWKDYAENDKDKASSRPIHFFSSSVPTRKLSKSYISTNQVGQQFRKDRSVRLVLRRPDR